MAPEEAQLTFNIVMPRIIDRVDGTFSVLEPDYADHACTSGCHTVGFASRESAQRFIDNLVMRDPDSTVREFLTPEEYAAAARAEAAALDLPDRR
jgi:hypothetical protein